MLARIVLGLWLALFPALAFAQSAVLNGFPPGTFQSRAAYQPASGGGALACSYTPVTTGTQGTAYTGATPSASGGTPAYTFSETGTLPGGLSISSSTGIISGTPTANGSFPTIQVKVTDSTSTVANCGSSFTLVISPSATYTGPGDINGAAAAWYGMRAFNAAYASSGTNPAVDLVDQAGANPITIVIKTDGTLDVGSISTWVTAHSVTTIKVKKLYDQSGNALHASQATLASMPSLTLNAVGTKPAVTFNGSQQLSSGNPASSVSQPATIAAVGKRISGTSLAAMAAFGAVGGNGPEIYFNASGAGGIFAGTQLNGSQTEGSFHSAQGLFNSTSSVYNVDGTNAATGNAGTATWITSSNVAIGNDGFNDFLTGSVTEAGIWAADKSANFSAMSSNAHTYYGF